MTRADARSQHQHTAQLHNSPAANLPARSLSRSPPAAPYTPSPASGSNRQTPNMSDAAPQPSTSAPAQPAAANGSARSSGCPPHVLEVGGPLHPVATQAQTSYTRVCIPEVGCCRWLRHLPTFFVPAASLVCSSCRRFTASRQTRRSSWIAACTAGGQVGAHNEATARNIAGGAPKGHAEAGSRCAADSTRNLTSMRTRCRLSHSPLLPQPLQSMPTARMTRRSMWQTACCMTGGTCRAPPPPLSAWRGLQLRRQQRRQRRQRRPDIPKAREQQPRQLGSSLQQQQQRSHPLLQRPDCGFSPLCRPNHWLHPEQLYKQCSLYMIHCACTHHHTSPPAL